MAYTLYIGNKNYSSWSMRGWLIMKAAGVPFNEVKVPLTGTGYNPELRKYSPAGRVPCIHDEHVVVWDSLAIAEYMAERHSHLWPGDRVARAWARSICAEMHSGFNALRDEMTCCLRERVDVRPWSAALTRDIERVKEIWRTTRNRFGAGEPFLFGGFTIADAFYAPVAFRFRTYLVELDGVDDEYRNALLAHPWLREWDEAAARETEIIELDEPRILYRDKLQARP